MESHSPRNKIVKCIEYIRAFYKEWGMTVKRQEGAPPDKYDGDVMVEVDKKSGRMSTLRRYSWKRQNPKNMDLSRWGAEAGVLKKKVIALSKYQDNNLNQSSADMAENIENENIEGVGLRTF